MSKKEDSGTLLKQFDEVTSKSEELHTQMKTHLTDEQLEQYSSVINSAIDETKENLSHTSIAMANTVLDMATNAIKSSLEASYNRNLKKIYKTASETDKLTGVPNLNVFERQMSAAIKIHGTEAPPSDKGKGGTRLDDRNSSTMKRYSALVLMDLDGFKGVNDIHGHVTGDKMLKKFTNDIQSAIKEFAQTLQQHTRGDTDNLLGGHGRLARIGGDEFTWIMTTEAENEEDAREHFNGGLERVQKLTNALHLKHDNKVFPIVSSMGLHVVEEGDTPTSAKEKADAALYINKSTKEERRQFAIDTLRERGLNPVIIKDIRADEEKMKKITEALASLQSAGVNFKIEVPKGTNIPDALQNLEDAGVTVIYDDEPPEPETPAQG